MPRSCRTISRSCRPTSFEIQLDAERIAKAAPPDRCHADRAGVAPPGQPAQLETSAPDFRADKSGDMVAAFAPVEAGATENPAAARR